MKGRGPWIQTYTGRKFYPFDPQPEDINIKDIAYVLSGEYRFGGHCKPRITVAQHSVLVSERLPLGYDLALWGLLHDASEAYVRDLNKPIKETLPGYKYIEVRIQRAIADKFDLSWPMPSRIHEVDRRMCATEAARCMRPVKAGFFESCGEEPKAYDDLTIRVWNSKKAMRKFLCRFAELRSVQSRG